MHAFRMPANRWQAFLVHLGISAALYVVLLYLIVFHWYPQPYFAADGGWQGIQIVTGVDLILGPVLTLIVYNLRKPELKRDLALIALFQAVAMSWGVWLVHGQRTAAVVFTGTNFQTLNMEQVTEAGEHAVQLVRSSSTHPPYFLVRLPAGQQERLDFLLGSMKSGIPLSKYGDRYEPIGVGNRMKMLESAIDIERRVQGFDDDRAALQAFLTRHGGNASDYAFVPLSARYKYLLLVLSRRDAQVVGALDIRPRAHVAAPPESRTTPDKPKP